MVMLSLSRMWLVTTFIPSLRGREFRTGSHCLHWQRGTARRTAPVDWTMRQAAHENCGKFYVLAVQASHTFAWHLEARPAQPRGGCSAGGVVSSPEPGS